MNTILDIGISFILWLQNLGSWLVGPMKLFTFMGSEDFFMMVAPAIYWCVDAGLGLRIGLLLMASNVINYSLKAVFHAPRPYWYDPKVHALSTETSFGIPSGHSQNAVVVWGRLAAWFRRVWIWVIALLLIIFIGLSRLFLGVHFPSDVLIGWLVGIIVLWIFIKCEKPVMTWFNRQKISSQILIALCVSAAFILLSLSVKLILASWTFPQTWWDAITITTQSSEHFDPLSLTGVVSNSGTFFGLALGAILLVKFGGYNARGPWWQLILRYLIGLVGVLLFWKGLDLAFSTIEPNDLTFFAFILRYIRYGMVGFWVAGLAPILFIKMKLAKHRSR